MFGFINWGAVAGFTLIILDKIFTLHYRSIFVKNTSSFSIFSSLFTISLNMYIDNKSDAFDNY